MMINWNEGWKVWKEDNAFRLIFSVPEKAIDVDLPYDAVFHQEQSPDSVNMGRTGFLDGGVFHYYKSYYALEEDRDKHLCCILRAYQGSHLYLLMGRSRVKTDTRIHPLMLKSDRS